jgi:hypothetical protein
VLTVVLVVAAFVAGYWISRPRVPESDYVWVKGQLVRIDPNGNRTPIGPPAGTSKDEPTEEEVPEPESAPSPPPAPPPPRPATPQRPSVPAPAATAPTPISPAPQPAKDDQSPGRTAAVAPSPAVPAPSAPAGFRVYYNLDLEGGDLEILRQVDLPRCIAACRSNARCRAYSFDKWNRFCFLKAEVRELRLNPRSVTGVPDNVAQPPRAESPITIERYRGKAFSGPGYRSLRSPFEACETACKNDKTCIAFTHQRNDNLCRLFDTAEEYFSDQFADSGGKRQRP